jgi:flagellar P-ring protein precursor FlgI
LLAALAASALALATSAMAATRIGDLTVHAGDVPRRLVGYGLVVGLDGTGDRSFGGSTSPTPTVRTVVNLLRRFDIEVPPDRLRVRNVAAVMVTSEVSPYLRAAGRFEIQVAALGDATSLRGGVLWMTPLVSDPHQPPVATAQGPVLVDMEDTGRSLAGRRGNSGRIADGGVMEVDPPPIVAAVPRLLLKRPDVTTASGIARAINARFGAGTAHADDPGAVTLTLRDSTADRSAFLASVDSLDVAASTPARIVVSAREGTVVAGGDVRVGPAVVSHHGVTVEIGGTPSPHDASLRGFVRVDSMATVQDVAAGLHAAGLRTDEIAAVFEALRAAGALTAELVIR